MNETSITFLMPTNSVDGTADVLVSLLLKSGQNVFRWNVDLWQHYEISFYNGCFFLSDPSGRSIDTQKNKVILLWRKPFTDLMNFDGLSLLEADKQQAQIQVGEWLRSLVAFLHEKGCVRLIEPYADRRLPKLYQLVLASEYFTIPQSKFSIRNSIINQFSQSVITKPLGDPSVGERNIFFTKLVEEDLLFRPYPWFIQQALAGGNDITCVYIDGESYFFICDYARDKNSIDWRVEINTSNQSLWSDFTHENIEHWKKSVDCFMKKAKLFYGRLDFILLDNTLYFLECNSNGQFGWLDGEDLILHHKFIKAALSENTRVSLYSAEN